MIQKNFGDIRLLDIGNTIQLVGAIWQGNKENLFVIFPDETFEPSFESSILALTVPEWQQFIRQSDLLETEILVRDTTGSGITKAIVRKSQRQVDASISWRRYSEDNYTCRYCGASGVPLTVDHIILWEEGGPTIFENLLSACKKCNRTRGNMSYEVWIQSNTYKGRSVNLDELTKQKNLDIVKKLEHLRTLKVNIIRSR